jgi:hypothetical protein
MWKQAKDQVKTSRYSLNNKNLLKQAITNHLQSNQSLIILSLN